MKRIFILIFFVAIFILPSYCKQIDFDNSEDISVKIENVTKMINNAKYKNADNKTLSALYWLRGGFYSLEKNNTMALKDYNDSLMYDSDNIHSIKGIEQIKKSLNDYNSALTQATKAIELNPKKHDYYLDRAGIYIELKKYDNAIKDCTKSIILKSKNPTAFEVRGMAEILNNQKEKGFIDLEYSKQQYYELGMYDEYQQVVKFINELNNIKKRANVSKNSIQQNNIIYQNDNYGIEKQLQNINNSLMQLNIDSTWKNY